MRRSLIIVIASFIVAVLLVNQFVDAPAFDNPKDKLKFVLKEKQSPEVNIRLKM